MVIPAELIVRGNDLALVLRRKHGNGQQTQYCGLWQLNFAVIGNAECGTGVHVRAYFEFNRGFVSMTVQPPVNSIQDVGDVGALIRQQVRSHPDREASLFQVDARRGHHSVNVE
ncbi:Uncharacterised protein [Mycobacterium tuberculosis]|nr:Uncharacterised protein [Mycobacterium tuberculosis]COZ82406.1 Uncharacterised protein [Mycobacterium tuberculosis]